MWLGSFMDRRATLARAPADSTSLGERSWYTYDREWLAPGEADQALETLLEELDYEARELVVFGKRVMQPRLMGWAGELGYRYSGQVLEPRPFHPLLATWGERLSAECGVPFNHVVINYYRNGHDNVGMHADDEPELGYEPVIASVSLGVTRKFVLQHKKNRKRKRHIRLQHGSLLVMGGTFQHRWRHAVPKQPANEGARLNLTYRLLHGPPGWRTPLPT